eukprot:3982014-Pleurochrysis_carterae.AAC.2
MLSKQPDAVARDESAVGREQDERRQRLDVEQIGEQRGEGAAVRQRSKRQRCAVGVELRLSRVLRDEDDLKAVAARAQLLVRSGNDGRGRAAGGTPRGGEVEPEHLHVFEKRGWRDGRSCALAVLLARFCDATLPLHRVDRTRGFELPRLLNRGVRGGRRRRGSSSDGTGGANAIARLGCSRRSGGGGCGAASRMNARLWRQQQLCADVCTEESWEGWPAEVRVRL